MRVLYVSKALVVAEYRAKLAALSPHVEIRGVMPERWGRKPIEPGETDDPAPDRWPVLLHGHNHLHLYRRAGALLGPGTRTPHLVHIDEEPYSAVTYQLARLARRRGVPALFFAWQNLHKRLPPPFAGMRARVFRLATGGIAGTEAAAGVLRKAGYAGPLAVIPQFGVDPERFAPDPTAGCRVRRTLGVADGRLLVGYGGRLVPEKGLGVLLAAVAAVPEVDLLVLGDGPERHALEVAAGRAGIRARVHFAGHRPSREVPRWLAGLDALVLPSVGAPGWAEQFGRILVEAMACGVPVVGARSGEIPGVVGDAGLLVPAGDPDALARALATLAGPAERRAALGRLGRARVLARYTHERIAADTAAFYRSLVA